MDMRMHTNDSDSPYDRSETGARVAKYEETEPEEEEEAKEEVETRIVRKKTEIPALPEGWNKSMIFTALSIDWIFLTQSCTRVGSTRGSGRVGSAVSKYQKIKV